jgi:hypothetical protein
MEAKILTKPITQTLGSITSFSGTIYIIIITLSICYNIGYLKQINPQMIDLIELGDYINDTVHNIWLFLLGTLIFFGGSLSFGKEDLSREPNKILIFGGFSFIVSIYYLLKGTYYSKFWPIIKQILENNAKLIVMYTAVILVIFSFLMYLYKGFMTYLRNRSASKAMAMAISSIIIFLFLVLMPYIGGITQGYIENKYLSQDNYQIVYSVDIHTMPGENILKDVYIIKKLNKGLIIRQFGEIGGKDEFSFLNWSNIKLITYKRVEELLSPL